MAGIGQYLKETQMELRHVAWPTRTQTIVYTLLVSAISLIVAAYLGLFDFLFTTGLTSFVSNVPSAPAATVQSTTTPAITVSTSTATAATSTAK